MNTVLTAGMVLAVVAAVAQCVADGVVGGGNVAPKRILCWGDSVTEGMAMPRGKDYPAQLEALLGFGYRVFNSGDGGENSVTILARHQPNAAPVKPVH